MGFADTWSDADPEGNGDNPPPDGTYDVALMDASAFTSKGGEDFVKLSWQTNDRKYHWDQLGGFGTVKQAGFTKASCIAIGVDVESVTSFEEMDGALKPLIGKYYEVEVRRSQGSKGEFLNTYVKDGEVTPVGPDVPADTEGLQPAGAGHDDDFKF